MGRAESEAGLEARMRDARRRRDDLYRRLGQHVKGCEPCARADDLQAAPLPFCPVGDRIL